jgi:hypothetical protein
MHKALFSSNEKAKYRRKRKHGIGAEAKTIEAISQLRRGLQGIQQVQG